jgi:hypothetical protein
VEEKEISGEATLAATAKKAVVAVPAWRGNQRLIIETTPADARFDITVQAGGKVAIERRSHFGEAIAIRWRIELPGAGDSEDAAKE